MDRRGEGGGMSAVSTRLHTASTASRRVLQSGRYLEFLESPGRISVPLWHLDAPSSDILALACKEAIPAPWTGAPWPTARRLGGPPGRATPPPHQLHRPTVPSVPSRQCPTAEGMGDEGPAGSSHVDGANREIDHGQDDHSMMYIESSAGQRPNHHQSTQILWPAGGSWTMTSLASPTARRRTTETPMPCPLAETSSRPCPAHSGALALWPSWKPGQPSLFCRLRYPLSDIHLGCLLGTVGRGVRQPGVSAAIQIRAAAGWDRTAPPSSICFAISFPSHPIHMYLPVVPSRCTLQMYLPDVPSGLPRASSWCVVGDAVDAMYLLRAHLLAPLPCISLDLGFGWE